VSVDHLRSQWKETSDHSALTTGKHRGLFANIQGGGAWQDDKAVSCSQSAASCHLCVLPGQVAGIHPDAKHALVFSPRHNGGVEDGATSLSVKE